MTTPYADYSHQVRRLHAAVVELQQASSLLQLEPLAGREWYEVLTQKLLPQLSDEAYLIVAVVGGTNIGKSVVFNHLAGCRASATSPLASGTKHPVCLVPPGFTQRHDLASVFGGFRLYEWERSEGALEDSAEDRLYWRTSPETPENLLVLDTPDIDSDAKINWRRADNIRRCADVLIAVLTQQKYNDAAVKQFFRKAAEEDKDVIVVFNQCQLPDDEHYWPMWLSTFSRETGVVPEFLYIAPNDRRAAEENRLPFYERHWAPEDAVDAEEPLEIQNHEPADGDLPRDLRTDLSRLHFGEIKIRTLRGALAHLVHAEHGVPSYLTEIERRSAEFRAAADLLSAHNLAEVQNWPTVPNKLLVTAIRRWWQLQREGWPARVHGFYNTLGAGLTWPIRFAHEKLQGPQIPPVEIYRRREWEAILDAVDKVYQKLQWFSDLGNRLLQPRLEALLGGTSRAALIDHLQKQHAESDIEGELQRLVKSEMHTFREERPQHYRLFKQLDAAAAAARPATSMVLFVTGMGPFGDAAAHLVTDTALQSVVHIAGDVAGGTVTATVGETALSSTAGSGVGYLEAKLRRMHTNFTARRVAWLAQEIKSHLLGSLPEELKKAARMPESTEFLDARAACDALAERLEVDQQQTTGSTS